MQQTQQQKHQEQQHQHQHQHQEQGIIKTLSIDINRRKDKIHPLSSLNHHPRHTDNGRRGRGRGIGRGREIGRGLCDPFTDSDNDDKNTRIHSKIITYRDENNYNHHGSNHYHNNHHHHHHQEILLSFNTIPKPVENSNKNQKNNNIETPNNGKINHSHHPHHPHHPHQAHHHPRHLHHPHQAHHHPCHLHHPHQAVNLLNHSNKNEKSHHRHPLLNMKQHPGILCRLNNTTLPKDITSC